ncbi:MAG: transposase zinc-binding domain-containing protein [Akkermansiaceae bacterium]
MINTIFGGAPAEAIKVLSSKERKVAFILEALFFHPSWKVDSARIPGPFQKPSFLSLFHGILTIKHLRKSLGKLRPYSVTTVQSFLRCGDLAAGFTRLQCPDCGHERLLAPSPISSTTSSGTPRKKQTPSSKIYGYFGIRES